MSTTYVVRVYRLSKDDQNSMVGIVETSDNDARYPFHGKDELWSILAELFEVDEEDPHLEMH